MLKIIRGTLTGVANLLYKISHRIPVKQTLQADRVKPWFKIDGDKTLRLNYDLNEQSIVFDLGGYKGEWTAQILCLYNSSIYIFEPYLDFFQDIKNKFLYNKKVNVFQFGLSNADQIASFSIADNGSSIFVKSDNQVDIKLVCATDFFTQNNISKIDLMKINIEGGEYDLLEHIIKTGYVKKIDNIQIQFHDFVPDAEKRMKAIQMELQKTHQLTYQYEFVWENWRLISR